MNNPAPLALHQVWLTPTLDSKDRNEQVADHLIRRGSIHESSLRAFLLLNDGPPTTAADPRGVIIDIGANHGQSVVSIAKVCPGKDIVCFEPLSWGVDSIEHLIKKRGAIPQSANIVLHKTAISNVVGELTLYVPGSREYMITSLATSDPVRARSPAMLSSVQQFFDGRLDQVFVHEIRTPSALLDSFKLNPVGIKIDVEGHELQVLQGAVKTIAASRPLLIVELSANIAAIDALLAGFGYLRFGYDDERQALGPHRSGNAVYLTPALQSLAMARALL